MSQSILATSCCLALLGVNVLGQTTAPAQPPVPAPQHLAEAARALAGVSDESLRSDWKPDDIVEIA